MKYKLKKDNLNGLGYRLTILFSLIILIDFIAPGSKFTDTIIDIKKEHQQYYNTARNSHTSFRIFTKNHDFSTSVDFAKNAKKNEKITYKISPLFKEINSHYTEISENKTIYSLRIFSGLILPIITILIISLAFKHKNRIGSLAFILQILLIGNLLFLIS